MHITSAEFIKSSSNVKDCPPADLPEYAFIGRSNVGKSSLINLLAGRKTLAKTSITPGKTQLINHFLINNNWYLVDLPGMGYAKVSQSERQSWERLISNYIINRENLLNTFMLVDSRLEPQKIDLEFMDKLAGNEIEFSIVFTKTDKLKPNELARKIQEYKRILSDHWDQLPIIFLTSAVSKKGRDEILQFIEGINNDYYAAKKTNSN
jgi:GTP-binding protein